MPDFSYDTETDLERLPALVPSKQAAEVLGVQSSALRMMVRRGTLDPPVSIGTNKTWYDRESVIRAWRRRQPEHFRRALRTGLDDEELTPNNSLETEQTPNSAEIDETQPVPEEDEFFPVSVPGVMQEMVRQLQENGQSQTQALTLLVGQMGALTAAVQTLQQELASERALRQAEQHRREEAERHRTRHFWEKWWEKLMKRSENGE